MTLDELRQIENGARDDEGFVRSARHSINEIAALRKADRTIPGVVPFRTGYSSGITSLSNIAERYLCSVVTDMLPEILRLAEMRMEAEIRKRQIRGKMRREQLNVYLSEPVIDEDLP